MLAVCFFEWADRTSANVLMMLGVGLLVIQPMADRCSVKNLFEISHYSHNFFVGAGTTHFSFKRLFITKDMVVFSMLSYEQSFVCSELFS